MVAHASRLWHLFASRWHALLLIRVIREQNLLLIEIARRLRRGFQEGLIQILLIERFDRYRAPDLCRFLVLRLNWDRFPDLRSGFCGLSARLA